jgi:hypothetical protein
MGGSGASDGYGGIPPFWAASGSKHQYRLDQQRARVEAELSTALTAALNALNNDQCAKLFGQGNRGGNAVLASEVLLDLFLGIGNYGDLTVGDITSPPGTVVSATTTPLVVINGSQTFNEADIVINDLAGTFVSGKAQDQAVTLLHELGHAMNDIFGPGTSQIKDDGSSVPGGIQTSMNNTALVKKDCFK